MNLSMNHMLLSNDWFKCRDICHYSNNLKPHSQLEISNRLSSKLFYKFLACIMKLAPFAMQSPLEVNSPIKIPVILPSLAPSFSAIHYL